VLFLTLVSAMLFAACATIGDTSVTQTSFIPETPSQASRSTSLSDDQYNLNKELEGYVALTSARHNMRLPKDADITLSGARKHATRVEFEPEETYLDHLVPYSLYKNTQIPFTSSLPRSNYSVFTNGAN
jgi:hypothetical protein